MTITIEYNSISFNVIGDFYLECTMTNFAINFQYYLEASTPKLLGDAIAAHMDLNSGAIAWDEKLEIVYTNDDGTTKKTIDFNPDPANPSTTPPTGFWNKL